MSKLHLYEVDSTYIDFLKEADSKIPNHDYASHNKLYCGIVLEINDNNYLAPLSSFNKQQATNFLIRDQSKNNKPIASLRFSFMIPVVDEVITIKDFSKETDSAYIALLSKELKYCRANKEQISKQARRIYGYGNDPQHRLHALCCKFSVLEEKMNYYKELILQ